MTCRKYNIQGWKVNRSLFSIIILASAIFLASQATCLAVTVTLQWGTSTGSAGYKVYYRADSSTQPFQGTGATEGASPIDVHTQTNTTISGLDPAHSYYFAVTAYDDAGTESPYSNIVYVPELTSPTVTLTNPPTNSTLSGTISVMASSSDNVGVNRVEFYVNNALQATDTTSPYSFNWDTSSVANGNYTLYAKSFDSAGNVGQSGSVSVSTSNTGATYTVVLGNATGSNFPNTVEDSYLNLNSSVNASSTSLNTYTWPAAKPANAILMKWDLSSLPAGAQIQSATLSLYMTESGGDSLYAIPVSKVVGKSPLISDSNGYTYDGSNPWDPSSIPYNSIPLAQSNIASPVDTQQINTTTGYKIWNVTSLVQDWQVNPTSNYGLLLNSSSSATSDSYRNFASSEASDPNQRPKLIVTYTVGLQPTLFVTLSGNGTGNVNSNPSGFTCETGTCTDQFDSGSSLTLIASPVNSSSRLSYLSGWSGGCSSISGSNCTVTMNTTKYATATFASLDPVHIAGGSYYTSLQSAYGAAASNGNIQAQAVTLTGNLTTNSNKTVTLKGGYNSVYSGVSGNTVMIGTLSVTTGALVVDNLIIR